MLMVQAELRKLFRKHQKPQRNLLLKQAQSLKTSGELMLLKILTPWTVTEKISVPNNKCQKLIWLKNQLFSKTILFLNKSVSQRKQATIQIIISRQTLVSEKQGSSKTTIRLFRRMATKTCQQRRKNSVNKLTKCKHHPPSSSKSRRISIPKDRQLLGSPQLIICSRSGLPDRVSLLRQFKATCLNLSQRHSKSSNRIWPLETLGKT